MDHLHEDWKKMVTREDIAKTRQDFKFIFNAAETLKSSINERYLDQYIDGMEMWEI